MVTTRPTSGHHHPETSHHEEGVSKFSFFATVWAVLTAIWSIFTPPDRTFGARLLLFQPAWLLRAWSDDDATWSQDLVLSLIVHSIWSYFKGHWSFPRIHLTYLSNIDLHVVWTYAQVFAALSGCGLLAATIVYRGQQLAKEEEDRKHGRQISETIDEDALLPPLLIPARTTHTRLIPQKHSFAYSYLFVGVPVGLQGNVGSVLSVDCKKHGWFHIDAADYLERTARNTFTLGEKLKRYLQTQGITDRDYSFAYLVTAPRLFGYSFNPVSFWYLYDSETNLKYMILEVNNTFDERRMYLLRPDRSSPQPLTSTSTPQPQTFTNIWSKDFHVSPFNDRTGTYSLRALDPYTSYTLNHTPRIDNTITLLTSPTSTSPAAPKLTARVHSHPISTQPPLPITPSTPSTITLIRFLLAHCTTGLMTLPRILWQARALYFRLALRVFNRPEITAATSIPRTYTADERVLARIWIEWLEAVVERVPGLRVRVKQAADGSVEGGNGEVVEFGGHGDGNGRLDGREKGQDGALEVKVVTPAWYSRMLGYGSLKEALDREGWATDVMNRTIVVESGEGTGELVEALLKGVSKVDSLVVEGVKWRVRWWKWSLGGWRWSFLQWLRCAPPAGSYGEVSSREVVKGGKDIRKVGFSELDRFVRWDGGHRAEEYRRIATKIFLADRIGLGQPDLIVGYDMLLRAILVLLGLLICDRLVMYDVLRSRLVDWDIGRQTAVGVLLINAVHLWQFVKG